MSKAEKIRHFLETTDKTNQEIAEDVGCLDAYVRVVQARLLHGGQTPSDYAWRENNKERYDAQRSAYAKHRYQTDPDFMERVLAANKARYARKKAKQSGTHVE